MKPTNRIVLGLVFALCAPACLDPGTPGNLVTRTVVEDSSLPRVQLNGTVLHAETFGNSDNPVLLVMHGGPGSDYRSLLPLQALANYGYYVVFWDQRGTGLSQRVDASAFTWGTLLEDLRQVVDHYTQGGSRPLVFIAHSWGAMYATWFINEYGIYGGRVRGAVLSEPGGFTKAQLDAYIKRLSAGVSFVDPRIADATWIGQFMSPTDHARADYMYMIQSGMRELPAAHCDSSNPEPAWRSGAVASKTMLDLADGGFDWTTNLKSFAPRVLFLRGDLNEANRAQDQKEMADAYANAEISTMENVGHCMIWEQPTEYVARVQAYLQAIGFVGGQP